MTTATMISSSSMSFIFLGSCSLAALLYMVVIFWVMYVWDKIPISSPPPSPFYPIPKVTIIIAARNEAAHIGTLLEHLLAQDYPASHTQILVVDDHSEDRTPSIVESYAHRGVQLIRLAEHLPPNSTQSFKKAAIATAMRYAKGTIIVQTDADCTMGQKWLSSLVHFQQEHAYKMVAAPVNFHQEKSLFERFQSLDFMGMMGVTGAGIYSRTVRLCNGANLLYTRQAFEAVGGHAGNEDKASGDDMFLMHKIANPYPKHIGFLKSNAATVYTYAKPNWSSFFQQRLRWATKNGSYQDYRLIAVNAIVFLICVLFFATFLLMPFAPQTASIALLIITLSKAIPDFFFLRKMARFFQRPQLMHSFIPSFFLHNIYIATIGVAASITQNYQWKGRKVK